MTPSPEENPRLTALFEQVDLREVMAIPTQIKNPQGLAEKAMNAAAVVAESAAESSAPVSENPVVFTPAPVQVAPVSPENSQGLAPAPVQVAAPVQPYNAERNAKALVYGIQAIEQLVLNPVILFKVHKSVGGKETKDLMRAANAKQMRGETLTEQEVNLIKASSEYARRIDILSDSIIPTRAKTEYRIEMAKLYCEESKVEVKAGLALWTDVAGDLVENVTKILLQI